MNQCEPIKIEVKIGNETKPDSVKAAIPEITTEGEDIVATSVQKAGYIAEDSTTISKKTASELDPDLKPENVKAGVSIFGVEGTIEDPKYQEKTIEAKDNKTYIVEPDAGIDGLKKVNVNVDVKPPLQDKRVNITRNGTQRYSHDAEYYGMDNVDIKVDVHPLLVKETLDFIHPGEKTQTTDISQHPGAYGFGEVTANVSSTDFRATAGDDNRRIQPNNGYAFFDSVYIPVAESVQFKAEHGGQVPLNYYEKPEGQGKVGMKTAIVDIPLTTIPEITENGVVDVPEGYIGIEGPINVKVPGMPAKYDVFAQIARGDPIIYYKNDDLKSIKRGTVINTSINNLSLDLPNCQITSSDTLPISGKRYKIVKLAPFENYRCYRNDIQGSQLWNSSFFCGEIKINSVTGYGNTLMPPMHYSVNEYFKSNTKIDISNLSAPYFDSLYHSLDEKPKEYNINNPRFIITDTIDGTQLTIKYLEETADNGFPIIDFYCSVKFNECLSYRYSRYPDYQKAPVIIFRNKLKSTIARADSEPSYYKIFVPDDMFAEYQADPIWSKYDLHNISELPPEMQ